MEASIGFPLEGGRLQAAFLLAREVRSTSETDEVERHTAVFAE